MLKRLKQWKQRRRAIRIARDRAAKREAYLDARKPRIPIWYRDPDGVMLKVMTVKVEDWHQHRNTLMETVREAAYAWNHRTGDA